MFLLEWCYPQSRLRTCNLMVLELDITYIVIELTCASGRYRSLIILHDANDIEWICSLDSQVIEISYLIYRGKASWWRLFWSKFALHLGSTNRQIDENGWRERTAVPIGMTIRRWWRLDGTIDVLTHQMLKPWISSWVLYIVKHSIYKIMLVDAFGLWKTHARHRVRNSKSHALLLVRMRLGDKWCLCAFPPAVSLWASFHSFTHISLYYPLYLFLKTSPLANSIN